MKVEAWIALGGSAAIAVASLWAAVVSHEADDAKARLAAQTACVAYATSGKGDGRNCDPALIALHDRDQASTLCVAALRAGGGSPSCPVEVAALIATEADLQQQLKFIVADRDDAIARAEARARASEQRKVQNAQILQSAPRDDAGLIVCDADCLRQRAAAGDDGS